MPKSSKLSPAEREVLIAKTAEDREWCIYCSDPAELPYYLSLAAKVGGRVTDPSGRKKDFPSRGVSLAVCPQEAEFEPCPASRAS